MGLVSHRHKNPKHTGWIVDEEDYTKNPKVVVQDWLFFSSDSGCINPNATT